MPVTVVVQEALRKSKVLVSILTQLAAFDAKHSMGYLEGKVLTERVREETGEMLFDSFGRAHTMYGLVEEQPNARDPGNQKGPDKWRLTPNGRDAYAWWINQAGKSPAVKAAGHKPAPAKNPGPKVKSKPAAAATPAAGKKKPSQIARPPAEPTNQ